VTPSQNLLDALLPWQQPIHGLVQIVGRGRSQMERLGQGTGSGVLIQAAGSGQFGSRVEDAGGNEGAKAIRLPVID
jgi:hypothetical protein